jgi:hypothetical protein
MARINVRAKGATGEREFCKWLYDNMNVPMPTRNLEQVRSGGSDVIDIEPFFFEVKRVEGLLLDDWWRQVSVECKKVTHDVIPVVAFRQNRKPWEFLIPATYIGCKRGYMRINARIFLEWSVNYIKK